MTREGYNITTAMDIKKYLFAFLLIILAMIEFSILGCNKTSYDEIYYIPKGFIGIAIIIYDQKDGDACEYDGRHRIYKIPENGLLLTKIKTNSGVISSSKSRRYYYIEDTGIIVDTLPSPYNVPQEEFYKMNYVGAVNYSYSGMTLGDRNIKYSFIMVDTLSTINSKYTKLSENYFHEINDRVKNALE